MMFYLQTQEDQTSSPMALARTADPAVDGTQTFNDVLYILAGSVIALDPTVFDKEGTYTLVKYTTLSFGTSGGVAIPITQANLEAHLTINVSDIAPLYLASPPQLDTVNKTIKVTLAS